MAHTIITFLGAFGPRATVYRHDGQDYSGGCFAEALHQFCNYDRMLVCVTEEAEKMGWHALQIALHNDPRVQCVQIPTGENTEEIWQIFATISALVNDGESVTFDITHGLRSLPFLVFLFAAYLKTAKHVHIDKVYYGALELNNKGARPAPVIDLTEFVSMFDWMSASDHFVRYGQGEQLAELVNERANQISAISEPDARALQQVSKAIQDTARALAFTMPIDTMDAANELNQVLQSQQAVIQTQARPLAVLRDQLATAYQPFALPGALDPSYVRRNVWRQHDITQWYWQKHQFVQCATLARETVISAVLVASGHSKITDRRLREVQIEDALGNVLAERDKRRPHHPDNPYNTKIKAFACCKALIDTWRKLADLRNDIAHCGLNEDADEDESLSVKLEQRTGAVISGLRSLVIALIGPHQ